MSRDAAASGASQIDRAAKLVELEARIARLERQLTTFSSISADVATTMATSIAALEQHTHNTSPSGVTGGPVHPES